MPPARVWQGIRVAARFVAGERRRLRMPADVGRCGERAADRGSGALLYWRSTGPGRRPKWRTSRPPPGAGLAGRVQRADRPNGGATGQQPGARPGHDYELWALPQAAPGVPGRAAHQRRRRKRNLTAGQQRRLRTHADRGDAGTSGRLAHGSARRRRRCLWPRCARMVERSRESKKKRRASTTDDGRGSRRDADGGLRPRNETNAPMLKLVLLFSPAIVLVRVDARELETSSRFGVSWS